MPRAAWRQRRGISRAHGLLAIAAVVIVLISSALFTSPISAIGRADVIDGDTLRIGRDRIRLEGLDAPELSQTCTDAAGRSWDCGREARSFVVSLVADQSLTCGGSRRDRYGRVLARCDSGNGDLGARIVSAGWAVSDFGYVEEAAAARAARRGIWSGTFVAPAQWRRSEALGRFDPWGWLTNWWQ